jgi:hypothetical protein
MPSLPPFEAIDAIELIADMPPARYFRHFLSLMPPIQLAIISRRQPGRYFRLSLIDGHYWLILRHYYATPFH